MLFHAAQVTPVPHFSLQKKVKKPEEEKMIVVLKRGVEEKKREQLIGWLKNQGLGVHISEGEYQTVLGLIGDTTHIDMDLIASLGIVDSVTRVTESTMPRLAIRSMSMCVVSPIRPSTV